MLTVVQPSLEDVQLLVQALFAVTANLDRARRNIPDAARLAVLQIAAAHAQARPSEIAEELGLHASSISRHVQALQDSGYVRMVVDPDDRRSYFVSVTAAGRKEIRRLTHVGMSRFASFVADWDADDVRTLSRLLRRLKQSQDSVGYPEDARSQQRRPGRAWQQAAASSTPTERTPRTST
jgi:DNA-binding MarR family transcriptional regulator